MVFLFYLKKMLMLIDINDIIHIIISFNYCIPMNKDSERLRLDRKIVLFLKIFYIFIL